MPKPNPQLARPIRTLIASVSKLETRQLCRDLSFDTSLQISVATPPAALLSEIEKNRPEVVLLDLHFAGGETPRLISSLLRTAGIPTVVRADVNQTPAGLLLDCLGSGAISIVNKPASVGLAEELLPSLAHNLRTAASASISNLLAHLDRSWPAISTANANAIFAIGAGTGSLAVLSGILSQLPVGGPGGVVIAPVPSVVTAEYAARLASRCRVRVRIATDGEAILPGQILIAPGSSHILVRRSASGFAVAIKPGPAVFDQKPSVEMLFGSIADIAGAQAIGVLLGGSGVGGVASLLAMKNSGGSSIVESPQSCVLAETTARAAKCNAADDIEPAEAIAGKIMEHAVVRSTLRAA